jgi:hypothetical protein
MINTFSYDALISLTFLISSMCSSEGGWPAPEKVYRELGMNDVRYNLATYYREERRKTLRR